MKIKTIVITLLLLALIGGCARMCSQMTGTAQKWDWEAGNREYLYWATSSNPVMLSQGNYAVEVHVADVDSTIIAAITDSLQARGYSKHGFVQDRQRIDVSRSDLPDKYFIRVGSYLSKPIVVEGKKATIDSALAKIKK